MRGSRKWVVPQSVGVRRVFEGEKTAWEMQERRKYQCGARLGCR